MAAILVLPEDAYRDDSISRHPSDYERLFSEKRGSYSNTL